MKATAATAAQTLYDRDLALWYADTLQRLRTGQLDAIDLPHLIEEIEGLAARDGLKTGPEGHGRELKTRLKVLLAHLLKRRYVPMPENYRGWENTITEQQEQLQDILDQSPSLGAYFEAVLAEAHQRALAQVRKDYPQVLFPDNWLWETTPSSLLQLQDF